MAVPESSIVLLNGYEMRCPKHPLRCNYVRFVDPRRNREVARYSLLDLMLRPRKVLTVLLRSMLGEPTD